jgi:hypothetical protein
MGRFGSRRVIGPHPEKHAHPPIWRKSWQVWLGFPPCAEHVILRFALAYPGAYFSLPFAGDAGKRAFQAGPELLRPPGGLEMMPAQAARQSRAGPRGTAPEAGHSSGR